VLCLEGAKLDRWKKAGAAAARLHTSLRTPASSTSAGTRERSLAEARAFFALSRRLE